MTREEAAEVLELMCGDWDPLEVDACQALRMGASSLREAGCRIDIAPGVDSDRGRG